MENIAGRSGLGVARYARMIVTLQGRRCSLYEVGIQ